MNNIYYVLIIIILFIIYYIPTYIFHKKTPNKALIINQNKYTNLDFLIVGIFLTINIIISTLELKEIVALNRDFLKTYDIFLSSIVLICIIRHFYYTLLENYNKIRVFIYPTILFIISIYEINISYNNSIMPLANNTNIKTLYIYIYYYAILAFIYLISSIVIPIICYKKRKSLK